MKKYLRRLDDLRAIPCVLRYADSLGMLESMMPELPDQLDGIGWCIASGEKGCCQVEPRPLGRAMGTRSQRRLCRARNPVLVQSRCRTGTAAINSIGWTRIQWDARY